MLWTAVKLLKIEGAIAGIDVNCIDTNSVNWNVQHNYIHSQLEVLLQCDL